MATDRLSLTQALEGAGIPRDGSEKVATAIFEAINDNVATKADLQSAADTLKADAAATKAELKADIATGNARIDGVRHQIELVEHKLLIKLSAVIVFAVGVGCSAVVGAMHWWPPPVAAAPVKTASEREGREDVVQPSPPPGPPMAVTPKPETETGPRVGAPYRPR